MSVFHNALQQIVKGTSLQVEVQKKVNECGSISFNANFKPVNATGYTLETLKAEFHVSENNINISAKVRDVSFYSNSEKNEQKLQEQMDALKIASTLAESEEIKQHLRTVGDEEIQKAKGKLSKKVENMQKQHDQLTEQSAKELLEKMVAAVREKHAAANEGRSSRSPIECKADVTILVMADNGEIKNHTVRVALYKRVAYNLNMYGATKQEIIEKMTNAWVVNNLEINVR